MDYLRDLACDIASKHEKIRHLYLMLLVERRWRDSHDDDRYESIKTYHEIVLVPKISYYEHEYEVEYC